MSSRIEKEHDYKIARSLTQSSIRSFVTDRHENVKEVRPGTQETHTLGNVPNPLTS